MSFGSAPSPPSAANVTNMQQGLNADAARLQQSLNMVNQSTPFGSLSYAKDANSPGGFSANVALSPQQQQLLDLRTGSQQNIGGTLQNLTGNFNSLYGGPPNIDPSTLTNKVMGWGQQYMQPIFNQQQSNLDAQLRNQGITAGSEAFNNAQNLQSRNVNNAYQSLLLSAEPTAFNQAVMEYQLPLQTASGLMNASQPQGPSFQTTPTESVSAPNYMQAAQNEYQANQANYATDQAGMWNAIKMGTGIAAAPFTGGASMFAAAPYAGGWGGR